MTEKDNEKTIEEEIAVHGEYGAEQIQVLEGLEAVRKRPSMYIGSISARGLHHLVYEVIDNSIDEALAGYCDHILVEIGEDNSITVVDNGRGIPVEMHKIGKPAIEVVMTILHAGGKFDNKSYKTSGGLHGVGSSVVNALSKRLTIDIERDGGLFHDSYEKGHPTTELIDGLLPMIKKSKGHGTTINFLPDDEIFDTVKFGTEEVKNRLHQTAYLNPKLIIHYEDKRKKEVESITFHEEEGIIGLVKSMTKDSETVQDAPVSVSGKSDGIEVECAFQYTTEFHENVTGFCNSIYTTEGGTHLTGFKTALTTLINTYARELGILKEKDANFTGADVRNGLVAVVSVRHPDPRFEGQTKTKLDNPDAAKAVSSVISEQLQMYFDRHLEELKAVIGCAEKSAKIRKAEEKTKTNMLTKPKYSFDSNGKLANCNCKDPEKCEIFIVEGDSAGGSAKTARNREFQAIFPIRGKILNVEKASINKILANAEIKTMVYAFACGFSEGYGNDFDISKLRYNKIIIAADADVDGAHIATLLLTLFYRFMPELLYEGHVYIAMPPLYKAIPNGKNGREEYLYDDKALEKYRKTHKDFKLQRYKGLGEMDAEQLWETTMNPATRMLKQVEIEDAQAASDLTALLMGNEVQPRKEYIYSNATEANLDV